MRIALIGYGRMGRMIEESALSRGHEITARIDIDNPEAWDSPALRQTDVAIEFTRPEAAWGNIQRAFDRGLKVVSGTTGWIASHEEEVRRLCSSEGHTLLWSSNFSLGVAITRSVSRYLADIMNGFSNYTPTLHETHHVHKLDHPSGTAITLAEDVVKEVDRLQGWREGAVSMPESTAPERVATQGSSLRGERAPEGWLRIDSERRGEVAGIHSITWDSEADAITLTHDAHSRKGFALGAVLAAEYTAQHSGLLTMDDLFNFPR